MMTAGAHADWASTRNRTLLARPGVCGNQLNTARQFAASRWTRCCVPIFEVVPAHLAQHEKMRFVMLRSDQVFLISYFPSAV